LVGGKTKSTRKMTVQKGSEPHTTHIKKRILTNGKYEIPEKGGPHRVVWKETIVFHEKKRNRVGPKSDHRFSSRGKKGGALPERFRRKKKVKDPAGRGVYKDCVDPQGGVGKNPGSRWGQTPKKHMIQD